jgi:hypothetical protein
MGRELIKRNAQFRTFITVGSENKNLCGINRRHNVSPFIDVERYTSPTAVISKRSKISCGNFMPICMLRGDAGLC